MKKAVLTAVLVLSMAGLAQALTSDIEAAIMNKNYEQAKALAAVMLKHEKNAKARMKAEYYMGVCQLRLGQYAEARSAFQTVMASAGSEDLYDKAALGFIEGLYMAGFYQEALKHADALLSKAPVHHFSA